jgi:phage regulator Rha-like protein
MNEFKIISLDNDKAIVSLDTIVKFSGNTEKVIQKHVRNNIERLIKNGLSYGFDLGEHLNYSEMTFNEQSATLLMTFLPNSEKVMDFKENLVDEFFKAREIITKQFLEIQENKNKLAQLELKAKDKVIQQLSNIVKDYKKITKDNIIYISANGLADDRKFTAKSFREFMKDLKLIKKVPKLTYYWEATEEGLDSQLVIIDANGTPYYNHEVCTDLYIEHLENGGN